VGDHEAKQEGKVQGRRQRRTR